MNGNFAIVLIVASFGGMIFVPAEVYGSFHFWDINEIYSNVGGAQQFIELTTTSNGQQFLSGHTITATSDGVLKTYTWTTNSPSPTANTKILLATTSMAVTSNFPTPNFIIPDNFFDPTADTLTFNFGEGSDVVVINGGTPIDGVKSLNDEGTEQTATPTNYAGETATPPFDIPQCNAPNSEDWTITESCEISNSIIIPASIIIQNNSVVTINSEGILTVPSGENIIIVSGSGLKLKQGSTLNVLS